MARVDKTESSIGVTRGTLKNDIPEADWNKPVGVGIDSAGLVVAGAGQSGIVGVVVADRTNYKAGKRCDILGNGSEFLEFAGAAGTRYTANTATGAVTSAAASATQIPVGFTVEADRLVVTI